MADETKKTKLVADLPDPPEVTDSMRTELLAQSREWRDAFSKRAREMESITADDMRARAR